MKLITGHLVIARCPVMLKSSFVDSFNRFECQHNRFAENGFI